MDKLSEISKLFKILSDENRLKIIEVLTLECVSVNDIAKSAEISQPLASHHLKVLRDFGIVRLVKKGTSNYY